MPPDPKDLYAKAVQMAKNLDDTFLDLGRALRQLLDKEPDKFRDVWQKSNLGRRKAYYLVEVSRAFDSLPIPKARLKKIGWTKLSLLAKHVTKDNVTELVELAEKHNAVQIEALMKGEKPINNAHCVLMYFSPKQYALFESVLIKFGAVQSGRGLVDKEDALIKALKHVE